jgi:hypothetical protein
MSKNDGRCTCEVKPRISMAKAAFNKNSSLFMSRTDLELRKELVKCNIWSIKGKANPVHALTGPEGSTISYGKNSLDLRPT